MPDAMTDSFLAGQGIPVEPGQVDAELSRLWGPASQHAGGPELENPHVTRIALANLVVESLEGACESLCGVLEEVIERYPCRAIVMRGSDHPGRRVAAEVSALCHLPAPGLPQVCSERIVLRAGPVAVDLLPGAVRPILEAELPFILLWTGDPRRHEALFRDLGDECSRLILDLPDPGVDVEALRLGLDPSICAFSRDVAWFGLARWRELVAQFFDPPCPVDALGRIDTVHIVAFAPAALADRTPRIAAWLAAWLAGQLGWKPQGRPARTTSPAETALQAEFVGPRGAVVVRIATRADHSAATSEPRLMGVTVTTAGTGGHGAETSISPGRRSTRRPSGSTPRARRSAGCPAPSRPPSSTRPTASPRRWSRRASTRHTIVRCRSRSGCSSRPGEASE